VKAKTKYRKKLGRKLNWEGLFYTREDRVHVF
jgi:hypothetical protein